MAAQVKNYEAILIAPESTIEQVMRCIDAGAMGIALVVNSKRKLLGTITDGDIRRAILQSVDLSMPISELLKCRDALASTPVTAKGGTNNSKLLELMQRHSIRHVPIVDGEEKVIGVVCLEDLIDEPFIRHAVIMAGGFGKRLYPLTENKPKPLLPVGDKPLIERVVEQLRDAGIRRVNIMTHYLSDRIKEHFADWRHFGISIECISETQPLGTAGALSLLDRPQEPVLVMNGDILTKLDFRSMLSFHNEYKATITAAVKQYDVQVPYGVVDVDQTNVVRLNEKPVLRFFVLAGIYLLNPDSWEYLPSGQTCDMPELINRLLAAGRRVVGFPVSEYWLDIGRLDDYQRAQSDAASGRI